MEMTYQEEKTNYHNTQFWVKDAPRVMGDLIARPSALQLGLQNIRPLRPKDQRILEAGCGTGYFARLIVEKFQHTKDDHTRIAIAAYDNNPEMLGKAVFKENGPALPRGKKRQPPLYDLRYARRDITSSRLLPIPLREFPDYRDGSDYNSFDLIFCVGVMIHWRDDEIKSFLANVCKALHPEGRIIISVTHPILFHRGSPSRCGKLNWVQHMPREQPLEETRWHRALRYGSPFRERYFDIDGQVFESNVFAYTIEGYHRLFRPFLEVLQVKTLYVRRKHLLHPSWGTHYGYPAFLQFVAKPYL
jgi:SAM-dependent methyltransferase